MKAIFERELNAYFNGIQGYLCGAFMLLFCGVYMLSINLTSGLANFEYVLESMDFILIVVIPLLTMRIISEERRQRTDQLLYSLPMSMTKIVTGKYLASLVVLALPILIMCMYPVILSSYGDVSLKISYSSMLAFFLLGASLSSIGMFISSLTENQGVAAGICFICMLLLYFSNSLASVVSSSAQSSYTTLAVLVLVFGVITYFFIKNAIFSAGMTAVLEAVIFALYRLAQTRFEGLFPKIMSAVSPFERFYVFIDGAFDVTAIIYFISVIAVFVFLTVQSMEKRRYS